MKVHVASPYASPPCVAVPAANALQRPAAPCHVESPGLRRYPATISKTMQSEHSVQFCTKAVPGPAACGPVPGLSGGSFTTLSSYSLRPAAERSSDSRVRFIRISAVSREGKEMTLSLLEEGGILGKIAMIDGGERSADATALENTTVPTVSRANSDLCSRIVPMRFPRP